MPHVPPLLPNDASQEVKDLYEEFCRIMRFPAAPNFIMTQGHSSSVGHGTWGVVRNVLVDGEISRWKKELIFSAISLDRGCRYCAAAHLACCRMLGVDHEILERLVGDIHSISDLKLRDMILFAVKCSKNPQSLTEADYEKLREHGFKQSEIVEVVAMSALAVYANIIADATGMESDSMFDKL